MSTVLVTGGAGFIGSALSQQLCPLGVRLVVADSLHPQVHPLRTRPPLLHSGAEILPFDVTHREPWEALLDLVRPDAVVHLAAETGTGQSLSEASRHAEVNVLGTTRMLDAMYRSQHRPQHIVLTSSRAVYGDGAWHSADGSVRYPGLRPRAALEAQRWDHTDSDGTSMTPSVSIAGVTQTHPTNVYAATKLAQEDILRAWCAATETKLSILRLQNVYGPGQSVTNSYTGVLTYFARQVAQRDVINVFEDGEIIRDFVFIDDVAAALSSALDRPPTATRLVDIGSGVASTILQVAQSMAAAGGAPAPRVSGDFRDGDVRAAWCDISGARNELGYEPTVTVTEGVGRLLRWVAEQSR